jgi:zinc transport system substrate-binding protein
MHCSRACVVVYVMVLAGCRGVGTERAAPSPQSIDEKLVVSTVNYPLAYFAGRIGDDLVEVRFPAPADMDPALWSPDAETIAEYQKADLILLNGANYARWVDRASLPKSKVVNTSAAFADRLIPMEGTVTLGHGPEGEHEPPGLASTTWLDPQLAIEQAQSVTRALIALRREREGEFNEHYVALESDLRMLDQRQAAAAEVIGNAPLLFSDPVYQYLIRRYKFNAVELRWDPNEAPDRAAWTELTTILMQHPARWMLWKSEPVEDTVAGLHEVEVGSLLYDPCGNVPETGDYLAVMDANAGALETIAETLNGQ